MTQNSKNTHIDINRISTYFDKTNIKDLIKEAISLETNNQIGFFYLDKKRAQDIIKRTGYQLPRKLDSLNSNIIIRNIGENVNRKTDHVTKSQQFIRWFGDWQNKPQSASKVVDADGKPLVMYHGTGSDLNVLNKSKTETTKVGEVTPITTETATLNDNLCITSVLLIAYNVKEYSDIARYSKYDTIYYFDEDELWSGFTKTGCRKGFTFRQPKIYLRN